MELPHRKYSIIYADPPWEYKDTNCQGAALQHYPAMALEEIKKLEVSQIADNDAILFMWATYPKLREALAVIEAWGFRYKTIAFQWLKLNPKSKNLFMGLGRWTRGNTEPCLLGTKGRPKRISSSVSQLILSAPRGRHSAKPVMVRKKIVELCGDLPRIELFARQPNLLIQDPSWDGWDAWGNEAKEALERGKA